MLFWCFQAYVVYQQRIPTGGSPDSVRLSLEVVCILLALLQLEADSSFFNAAEVARALALRIGDQRRGEVNERIMSTDDSDLAT